MYMVKTNTALSIEPLSNNSIIADHMANIVDP